MQIWRKKMMKLVTSLFFIILAVIAKGDRMFLRMQDFDFTQILPQICPNFTQIYLNFIQIFLDFAHICQKNR